MLKNAENIALQNLPILYTFVLQAEIRTTFAVRVVQISACNRNVYKNGKFWKAIFSAFCTFTIFDIIFSAVVMDFVFPVLMKI